MNSPIVSVIIPVYNEERYLADCLESLIEQDLPSEDMEWIIVDAGSGDASADILEKYRDRGPFVMLSNPGKTTPSSLNMAIKKAKGRYIVRMDAHAVYPPDYISKCIGYLEEMNADNAGGMFRVHGTGTIGKAFAAMLTSPFGAGGASFRSAKRSGFVDTVPFGCWRRELFDRIGLFDEDLVRSEDNDLNQRIHDAGGRVYLAADVKIDYQCRNTLSSVLKTGLVNGNALFFTARKNPSAMKLRHYVPFIFLVSLVGLGCGSSLSSVCKAVLSAEAAAYLAADLYFSAKNIRTAPVTVWLYPLFHLTYGLGSALGLVGIRVY
ncbi:MAG: glycosyltransferase family 2 protein [Oscillospiraceae bacterium]|nr:glycosyltransferase family 2 protein [Oscillospiraceae bacterium]